MQLLTIAPFTTTDANYASLMQPYIDGADALLHHFQMLLHELIHAAYGEPEVPHDLDPTRVFFEYADNTSLAKKLPPKHADALRHAYSHVFS